MKEEQTLLFDLHEAQRLGLIGMHRAAEPDSVKIWFAQSTEYFDDQPIGWQFSADDMVGHHGLVREVNMNDNNYVGSWFRAMAEQGRIKEVGRIRSRRVTNHGKKIPLWQKVW